jgi:hypothetical protein
MSSCFGTQQGQGRKQQLTAVFLTGLVIGSPIEQYHREIGCHAGQIPLLEGGQVGVPSVLLEVARKGDQVLRACTSGVIDIVEVLEAGWRHSIRVGARSSVGFQRGIHVDAVTGGGVFNRANMRQVENVGALRTELAKPRGGLDHVDVVHEGLGNAIRQCSQSRLAAIHLVLVPCKAGVKKLVGCGHRCGEGDPVIVDRRSHAVLADPCRNAGARLVRGSRVRTKLDETQVLAVVWMAWCSNVESFLV